MAKYEDKQMFKIMRIIIDCAQGKFDVKAARSKIARVEKSYPVENLKREVRAARDCLAGKASYGYGFSSVRAKMFLDITRNKPEVIKALKAQQAIYLEKTGRSNQKIAELLNAVKKSKKSKRSKQPKKSKPKKSKPQKSTPQKSKPQANHNQLKELGGWLIGLGLAVVMNFIWLLVEFVSTLQSIFKDGMWAALTTADSASYVPWFNVLLIGDIALNVVAMTVSIYLIYLFVAKHYWFPSLFISLLMILLILIPVEAWFITKVFPNQPMFHPETMLKFIIVVIIGFISFPYLLISKRVRATFVDHSAH